MWMKHIFKVLKIGLCLMLAEYINEYIYTYNWEQILKNHILFKKRTNIISMTWLLIKLPTKRKCFGYNYTYNKKYNFIISNPIFFYKFYGTFTLQMSCTILGMLWRTLREHLHNLGMKTTYYHSYTTPKNFLCVGCFISSRVLKIVLVPV